MSSNCIHPSTPKRKADIAQETRGELQSEASPGVLLKKRWYWFFLKKKKNGSKFYLRKFHELNKAFPSPICDLLGPELVLNKTVTKVKLQEVKGKTQ